MSGAEPRGLESVYQHLWNVRELEKAGFFETLPTPRSPDFLLDMVADAGLPAGFRAIDVGCGRGNHACELAERFAATVVASDPLEVNRAAARAAVAARDLGERVRVENASIEALPYPDEHFGLLWCRGVLIHVSEVARALRECHRVLRPDGAMLLMLCSGTELLCAAEAALLCERMGFVAENLMGRTAIEALLKTTGFGVERSEELGGEFAEHYQALDGRCLEDLLRIAHLQRGREAFIAEFGRDRYETVLGMCYWQVYQLLGKISYKAYLLRKHRSGMRP